jgi:hypothetical protein
MAQAQLLPRVMTEAAFLAWLGNAKAGDRLTYHRGVLALDTVPVYSRLRLQDRLELGRVARRALQACERGFVHLVQERHGIDDTSYIAVARGILDLNDVETVSVTDPQPCNSATPLHPETL